MPSYKYTATGANGKTYRGVMEAQDASSLYEKLRTEGKFVTQSSEVEPKRSQGKLKIPVVADFCRQLGTLLGAGVSLVRVLSILANEDTIKPAVKAVYTNLLRTIRQGVTLSDAMQAQSPAFPELLVNMFRSAELSGNLDQTAQRMAVHYEKEHKTNSKVKSAMVYPLVLLIMMLFIVLFISGYVLPQFKTLFATMGELPWATRVVMGFSSLVTNYWYLLLMGAVLLVIVIRVLLALPSIRHGFDRLKLKLPVVGKLLRTIYTARFARTLSSLYGSGVPIISAISTASRTVGNKYLEKQFDHAAVILQRGGTLSEAIRSIKGFENKLSDSVYIGEETGNLDEMLDVTADSYDYASEQAISRLVTLLEPAMLIVLGVMVGFIMLAILVPIFGSYSAIEQSQTYY